MPLPLELAQPFQKHIPEKNKEGNKEEREGGKKMERHL